MPTLKKQPILLRPGKQCAARKPRRSQL